MTSSQLSVTKSNGALIVPSEPTPNHSLPLSRFDKNLMSQNFAKMFFVYKQGPQQPAGIIKDALAKALVPYYPLAGRIVRSEKGEIPGVACTGDGVWFVEASADCSLEDVMGLLELPPSEFPEEQLFPYPPNPVGRTIMLLQVTQFVCGGFVVGLKYDHIIADGAGIAQIMKAIAEIARGLKQPVVAPVWLREQIPDPTIFKMAQPSPPRQAMCLEHLIIDIPLDHVNQVKTQFMEQTGKRCSTFDITVAQLWQCRIRAIGPDSSINSVLGFPVNARRLLSNLPTEGYYGNCLFPVTVATSCDKIAKASIIEVVTLIKDAKKRLPDEFAKWAKGDLHQNANVATVRDYDMMVVTDWRSLGFSDVDYGWGGPSYFAPAPQPTELVSPPVCIVIKSLTPNNACRLITRCVKKEHFEVFSNQMTKTSTIM